MISNISVLLSLISTVIHGEIIAVSSAPPAFLGPQSGIGSWFYTDADGTNGNSWCGYPYNDGMPIFAPSLALMGGATSGVAWTSQTQEYCGRQVKVTWKGTSKLLYLGDAFSQPRSNGAIDIAPDAWADLYGQSANGNHDIVMDPIDWKFTGNVDTEYTAKGAVFNTAAASATSAETATLTNASTPTAASTATSVEIAMLPASSTQPEPTDMITQPKSPNVKSTSSISPSSGAVSTSSDNAGSGSGSTGPGKGVGNCDWQWHCQGAPCNTYNDCGDPFSCINYVCT